jgi:hypothetical protein
MDDGYPTDDTIDKIKRWPILSPLACRNLLRYCQEAWAYPDYFTWRGKIARVSTGGWSGNEDIIAALRENRVFWALCWMEERRGGHYKFEAVTLKEA